MRSFFDLAFLIGFALRTFFLSTFSSYGSSPASTASSIFLGSEQMLYTILSQLWHQKAVEVYPALYVNAAQTGECSVTLLSDFKVAHPSKSSPSQTHNPDQVASCKSEDIRNEPCMGKTLRSLQLPAGLHSDSRSPGICCCRLRSRTLSLEDTVYEAAVAGSASSL